MPGLGHAVFGVELGEHAQQLVDLRVLIRVATLASHIEGSEPAR